MPTATPPEGGGPGIDFNGAIEKVGHALSSAGEGALVVEDRVYRAEFDPAGVGLKLRRRSEPGAVGAIPPEDDPTARRPVPGSRKGRPGQAPAQRVEGFEDVTRFEVSTTAVQLGAERHQVHAGPWNAVENRAERPVTPDVVERVTAREGHVEWDFIVGRAPPPGADLRIEATVAGAGEPVLASAADPGDRGGPPGWRWPVGDGRAVRMGELVVLDANGRQVHRELPAVRAGQVALTVPASVLAGSSYPLTLDPIVSPEYPVSEPAYAAAGEAEEPAAAFDGTNFLVVWEDRRPGTTMSDIYGTRVSRTGRVLDPAGIAISTAADYQDRPAVAFDGTNFLVVWQDLRGTALPTELVPQTPVPTWLVRPPQLTGFDLYGARVGRDGNVLDPAGIPISTAPGEQSSPVLAFDGTNFLVVWTQVTPGTGFDILGARVGRDGNVLDPAGIPISVGPAYQYTADIAFDGTDFVVGWTDERSASTGTDVYGARITKAGEVRDPNGIPISTAPGRQSSPNVAAHGVAAQGGASFVVWTDERSASTDANIYGARLSGGNVVDPAGIAVSTAPDAQSSPTAASDGSNFLVAWKDQRSPSGGGGDLYAARVSAGGSLLDAGGLAISAGADEQSLPDMVFDGTDFFVVWSSGPSSFAGGDIHGARVRGSGQVLDPAGILLSSRASDQRWPAIAFDGTNYLVVWADTRPNEETDVYGARVNQAGTVLDTTGIPISTAVDDQEDPAVTFDGAHFLVVWDDARKSDDWDVYGARVTTSGAVLDPAGIAISTAGGDQVYPALSSDGTNTLVVWVDWRSFSASSDLLVYGARVSSAGAVLDPSGVRITTASGWHDFPAVAFDGDQFLVVWMDAVPGAIGDWDVYGARVAKNGTVTTTGTDPRGIRVGFAPGNQSYPRLTFDGTRFLVVWEDERSARTTGSDIYGARVSAAGVVADPSGIRISDAPGDQGRPAVGADSTKFLVVWEDRRSTDANGSDIYGARVRPSGTVIDEAGFSIAASGGDEVRPAVVSRPDRFVMAYSRAPRQPATAPAQTFLRIITDAGAAPTATPSTTTTLLPNLDRSYRPLTPARILDTRTNLPVPAMGELTLKVTDVGGVPKSGVEAVVLRIANNRPAAHGNLAVWPSGEPKPNASSLNWEAGENDSNTVIAKVGTDGNVKLANQSPGATHFIADVVGWFRTGSEYEPLTPARVLDTRTRTPPGPLPARGELTLDVTGVGGVPESGAEAVVLRIADNSPTSFGNLVVWPGTEPKPNASSLNWEATENDSVTVIVKVGSDGTVKLANNSEGSTHFIADVVGWFPP